MGNWSCDEEKCSISYTLDTVGGRWKWLILYKINDAEIMRYGEIKRSIPSITHKMLSQHLKELTNSEIILRKEYYEIPPKVEYSLTEKGKSLLPILSEMAKWGDEHKFENKKPVDNSK